MSHKYRKDGFEYPSVTTIISDCTDKSGALTQWAANMVVAYIKESCDLLQDIDEGGEHGYYDVPSNVLEQSRFNFRNVSQEALDIGSAVHSAIEYYLKTGREPKIEHEKVLAGFVAFLEWKDEVHLEPIALEETVYGNCWGGMLDFRGWLQLKEWSMRKQYVIDFKTSKAIYPADMGPQIAAYRYAKTKELQEIWDGYDKERFNGIYEASLITGSGILRLDKETGLPEWKDFSKRYESDLNIFNKMVELYFARHPIIARKAGWREN